MLKRYYLLLLVLFSVNLPLKAQDIAKSKAVEEMEQLQEAIATYQPALKLYNPKFVEKATELRRNIASEKIPSLEHFANLSALCALSNEGHFKLGNWQDTVHAGFLDNSYAYLPLSVRILSNRIWVWYDLSGEQKLKQGDEIIKINNRTAREILDLFLKHYPADGSIETYVFRTLEQGFNWMYYLYAEQPEYFELEIKRSDGKVEIIKIKALNRDLQFANYAKYYPDRSEKAKANDSSFYTLEHREHYTYLKLPSFDRAKMEEYNIRSGKFYRDLFQEFSGKKVNSLVIDLRGNTGGKNEMADDMVPYILKNNINDTFLKKSISWEGRDRTYRLPTPSKYLFQGSIFVLVDGRTYSAGSTLARYLKEYGKAVIIGEETGTRYEGFAAGSTQYITLKHSGLKIGIPRYHMMYPPSTLQKTTNRGVLPEHKIEYTIESLIKARDLHLEKAEQLINNIGKSS